MNRFKLIFAVVAFSSALQACQSVPQSARSTSAATEAPEKQLLVLNRVTWGATTAAAREIASLGTERWLEAQLKPDSRAALPAAAQAQIDALTITQRPFADLALEIEQQRRDTTALSDPAEQKVARQAYQQALTKLGREAATRSVLRALYSPNQLQEQMTWFWMNHFNVFQGKANIRAYVGDYEERIRAASLGRFRDLLAVTARHPAMLRYLDNAQNASNRINENYARELMELHTLGVNGGYTQRDVQELARILTGFGINLTRDTPRLRPERQGDYLRAGVFEFNPARHDYGDKTFLGSTVKGRGPAELDEALDRLARNPATAKFISRKLAVYFVADEPPPALVERMTQAFRATDGDIAAVLRTMFKSDEFAASLGGKFKDPAHYVYSAVRYAYDGRIVLNTQPILGWLNRMGEGLYLHQTPDGYALNQDAWASPGQMATRFEIAKTIGSGAAGLFRSDAPQPADVPAFPQLSNALYYASVQKTLAPRTLSALDKATSPQEWNTFLLSSPEFMQR